MRKRSRWSIAAAVPAAMALAAGWTNAAAAADRASLIKEFPADVQKLFTPDVPDAVIEALLKVRKAGADTFVLNDSGGELYKGQQLAYLKNWEAITGWTIKDIAPSPDPGQVKAQVDSGHPQYDLFETGSNGDAMEEEKSGLLAKLDTNLLNPLIAKFPNDGYQHTDYWVQYSFFGVLLTWDLRKWPMSGPHPTSPKDLFDTAKFPGKRCLYKYPEYGGTLEYPLLADGVAPDKLYPLDVDRAFKKLDTIKNDLIFWTSNSQSQQLLTDGEVVCGNILNGRAYDAAKKGAKVAIEWNQNIQSVDYLVVPKGAKNADVAMGLIDEMTKAENQAKLANMIAYSPTNPAAFSAIHQDIAPWLCTNPNNADKGFVINAKYWRKILKPLTERFELWKLS